MSNDFTSAQMTKFYHELNIKLARSIRFKSHATAIAMNEQIDDLALRLNNPKLRVDHYSPETWRYYLHMQGRYHEYDKYLIKKYYDNTPEGREHPLYPINGYLRVKSLDTDEIIDFTIENLARHRGTWKHYTNKDDFYNQLIDVFPDLQLLIDGICKPLDFKTCLNAPEFKILDYDHSLVEKQELYLMDELDKYIRQVTGRFHSRGYMNVNPLYRSMRIAVVATHLPGMITALREQYAKSDYAHSYHIWNYLGSYFRLDQFRDQLTLDQALYLYRHIRYIDIHAGKQATFEQLIEVLLTRRDIPLFGYTLDKSAKWQDVDLGIFTKMIDKNNPHEDFKEFISSPIIKREQLNLNDTDYLDENQLYSVTDIFDKELPLTNGNNLNHENDINKLSREYESRSTGSQKLKILESEVTDYGGYEVYPIEILNIDYWVHLAFTDRYPVTQPITNPLSGELTIMNARQAFIVFYYCLIKLANKIDDKLNIENAPIPPFTIMDVFHDNVDLDWNDLRDNFICERIDISEVISDLQLHYPVNITQYSVDSFSQFVKSVQDYKYRIRRHLIYHDDLAYFSEIEHLFARLMFLKRVSLIDNDKTFHQFFNENHWEFDKLDDEQLEILADRIYTTFTGQLSGNNSSIGSIQKAMLSIMARLSSYSIQFTRTVKGDNIRILDMPQLRFGHVVSNEMNRATQFQNWLAKFQAHRGKEGGSYAISFVGGQGELQIYGQEMNVVEHAVLQPHFEASGYIDNYRHDRTGLVNFRRKVPLVLDVIDDHFYLYNGTIYYWNREESNQQIATGIPVKDAGTDDENFFVYKHK